MVVILLYGLKRRGLPVVALGVSLKADMEHYAEDLARSDLVAGCDRESTCLEEIRCHTRFTDGKGEVHCKPSAYLRLVQEF
jgi:hypothetical protein